MPTVFAFSDFRTFLREHYEAMKKVDTSYSYRRFARQAGLGSPNYMKLIIDGKRNLTIANIHQFAHALKLSFDETQYFEAMVLASQAKSTRERSFYRARVASLKQAQPRPAKTLKLEGLLAQPSYLAILVCLDGASVKTGASDIAKRIDAREGDVVKVIALLQETGLLSDVDGRFRLSDQYLLMHDRAMTSGTQKAFLRAQLELSKQALDKRYSKDAKFYSNTFTISADTLEAYQSQIAGFIDDLMDKANGEPAERVVQLNVQFFPFRTGTA